MGYNRIGDEAELVIHDAHPHDDVLRVAAHVKGLHIGTDLPDLLVPYFAVHLRHDDIGSKDIDLCPVLREPVRGVQAVDHIDDLVCRCH